MMASTSQNLPGSSRASDSAQGGALLFVLATARAQPAVSSRGACQKEYSPCMHRPGHSCTEVTQWLSAIASWSLADALSMDSDDVDDAGAVEVALSPAQ